MALVRALLVVGRSMDGESVGVIFNWLYEDL